MAAEYAIEMRGITKTFGSVVANKDVNLTLRKGEILALLGENGSGKTTLMNMLSGIYQPDSGEILVDGTPVSIRSPQEAKTLGIGMVFILKSTILYLYYSLYRLSSPGRTLSGPGSKGQDRAGR